MEKIGHKLAGSWIACVMALGPCMANAASPYAGEQGREIKSLSAEDVQAYLAGKGMGFAKAAELNGYPGPSHVLSLADQLSLTAQQKEDTSALFKSMETRAIALGHTLIEKERQLDQAFADQSITHAALEGMLRQIASLQAQLRQAHLEAHLAQVGILTPVQIAAYNKLRGYDKGSVAAHKGHAH